MFAEQLVPKGGDIEMSAQPTAIAQTDDAIKRVRTFLRSVKSIVRVTPELQSRAKTILEDTLKAGVDPQDPVVTELREWISENSLN